MSEFDWPNYTPPVHEVQPTINLYFPDWWHKHGSKMRLQTTNANPDIILIAGSAASVTVSRHDRHQLWAVGWEIVQSQREKSQGLTLMDDNDLQRAFGLRHDLGSNGEWMVKRYGGTTASQGNFHRWQRFLNIPHPGTGLDGDLNVSVELNDATQQAIRQIIGARWADPVKA